MTTARLDKTATIEDLAQVAQRRIPKTTLGYSKSAPACWTSLRWSTGA